MRTAWEKIYDNYFKGGEAYATLGREIRPSFKKFLKNTKFRNKSCLDIGCGNGKYLVYLRSKGFSVAGIDSSPTAVRMSKKLLGKGADIRIADMFSYKMPKNKYDLIVCIDTIHHMDSNRV